MKKICCLLALTILAGRPAFADETPATPPEKQNTVLGQTEKKAAQDTADKKARDAQALFEESLRQMMPLDQGQIQEYRSRSDERDRALLPVSPTLNTRTVRVTLELGRSPVPVFTTANIATSLVFHDSTGQPWPVTSVTNGGPSFFQVLRPELPDAPLYAVPSATRPPGRRYHLRPVHAFSRRRAGFWQHNRPSPRYLSRFCSSRCGHCRPVYPSSIAMPEREFDGNRKGIVEFLLKFCYNS